MSCLRPGRSRDRGSSDRRARPAIPARRRRGRREAPVARDLEEGARDRGCSALSSGTARRSDPHEHAVGSTARDAANRRYGLTAADRLAEPRDGLSPVVGAVDRILGRDGSGAVSISSGPPIPKGVPVTTSSPPTTIVTTADRTAKSSRGSCFADGWPPFPSLEPQRLFGCSSSATRSARISASTPSSTTSVAQGWSLRHSTATSPRGSPDLTISTGPPRMPVI